MHVQIFIHYVLMRHHAQSVHPVLVISDCSEEWNGK